MKIRIDIANRQSSHKFDRNIIKKLIKSVFKNVYQDVLECRVSLVLIDKKEMASLNKEYLHHQGATDVISFLYWNKNSLPGDLFGEVIVCPEVAYEKHKTYHKSPQEELYVYIIHGLLHLMGYNDKIKVDRDKINIKQNLLLKQFIEGQE